jgi:hypothetical protein
MSRIGPQNIHVFIDLFSVSSDNHQVKNLQSEIGRTMLGKWGRFDSAGSE